MTRPEIQLERWMRVDALRMQALQVASTLDLPDCWLAAGFVRNLAWDRLHHKMAATPLNDIDVIYFDSAEDDPDACYGYEAKLHALMPGVNWQVRNQARMHLRNGDAAYQSSLDAMRHWPEKETATAVRMNEQGEPEFLSGFGFESLFALKVSHNPVRDIGVFRQRMESKGWLDIWPKLELVDSNEKGA